MIAVAVAHHCFLSRSFKIAHAEYRQLFKRFPFEPLLLLCVAVSQLQMVMSRANRERGRSVLLVFGWLGAYAKFVNEQEAAYNAARTHHHLGLSQLAAGAYERAIDSGRRYASIAGAVDAKAPAARDLSREAVHNLARVFCASGNKEFARCTMRSMPVT